jgi:hypothetical protein
MGETQCWMVGTATAEWMVLLDPAAWTTDACEHDPEDAVAIERLITHELVHAFHGQHAPSPDFTGMDDLAWWIEGVATYASGQVPDERLGNACRSLRDGGGPAGLAEVWTGPDRYGFAGSLAEHIDRAHGRDALRALLRVGTTAEALESLGTSEEELLRAWRADLLGPGSGGSPSRCDGVAP